MLRLLKKSRRYISSIFTLVAISLFFFSLCYTWIKIEFTGSYPYFQWLLGSRYELEYKPILMLISTVKGYLGLEVQDKNYDYLNGLLNAARDNGLPTYHLAFFLLMTSWLVLIATIILSFLGVLCSLFMSIDRESLVNITAGVIFTIATQYGWVYLLCQALKDCAFVTIHSVNLCEGIYYALGALVVLLMSYVIAEKRVE